MSSASPTDGRGVLRLQRRDAIVDAARGLAAAHGSDGFTVDQVAQVAGVSRRTVFNHFATVDDLQSFRVELTPFRATALLVEPPGPEPED